MTVRETADGLVHFSDLSATASVVPEWIPPGQKFWAAATGLAFLLASIAMFSGVLAALASRLLTVMLVVFGALVWAPSLLTDPHMHRTWAGNSINLAMESKGSKLPLALLYIVEYSI